jgi:hypothetical protein
MPFLFSASATEVPTQSLIFGRFWVLKNPYDDKTGSARHATVDSKF